MRTEQAIQRREDEDQQPVRGLHVTKRIDAGHILQVVVMVVAAIVFSVGIYVFVLGRLSDHDGKLLLLDQEYRANKEFITRVDEAQRQLSSELRQKLDKVIDMIGDLRAVRAPDHR